ncbi:pyruvate kinase [Candidatus Uhrbacteria bacterium]|nr:pyruvate kinase [Candidatus Uhrbacteria bacterium]
MKLTKIVCTIGPASEKTAVLKQLMRSGMNMARLNFSHGTYRSHAKLIKNIRASAKALREPITILQDLQGPRIRIGEVAEEGVVIKKGQAVVIVPQKEYKSGDKPLMLPTHYPQLASDLKKGQHILIADGAMDVRVTKIFGLHMTCTVVVGGTVHSHKGMNIPASRLSVPSITAKDKEDLAFGVKQKVDYVALSFVRSADDVKKLRSLLKRHAQKTRSAASIGIISKIERREAVRNFDEILEVSDGIMVARGDLGIEIPAQKVPIIQKQLIEKCIAAHKPVIVATQMLESMIANRRPTRAEVSDVANAVIDRTDAVMLSGESATGKYPVETVQMMARIAKETEESRYDDYVCQQITREKSSRQMIAHAACEIVRTRKLKALIIKDDDPELIAFVAAHRPEVRIIGFSENEKRRRQLNLLRGVTMYTTQKNRYAFLKKVGIVKNGDRVLELEDDEVDIELIQ